MVKFLKLKVIFWGFFLFLSFFFFWDTVQKNIVQVILWYKLRFKACHLAYSMSFTWNAKNYSYKCWREAQMG